MTAEPFGLGYHKSLEKEPLILEPEDWNSQEWATLCKLSGRLPAERTERIVLHVSSVEYYIGEEVRK